VVLGVVQLGIPYILYSIAIRRVTALEAILIPMLEPILNPLWVALVHGEVPGAWSIAGGALSPVDEANLTFDDPDGNHFAPFWTDPDGPPAG
jgi:hypothetical protein